MSIGVVLVGDAAAALEPRLRELGVATAADREALSAGRVFSLGVGDAARAALLRSDVDGAVAIDGELPVDEARAGAIAVPVLAIVAEDDEGAAYSFAKALHNAGVLNETVVYDGVERGFLGAHEQATEEAWRLVRRFMGVPSPEPPTAAPPA